MTTTRPGSEWPDVSELSQRKAWLFAAAVTRWHNDRETYCTAHRRRNIEATIKWAHAAADGTPYEFQPAYNFWLYSTSGHSAAASAINSLHRHQEIAWAFYDEVNRPWWAQAPSFLSGHSLSLANHIYDKMEWEGLPILGDMLEDEGADQRILNHLRSPGPHVKGCWALDLILGKE